MHAITKRLWRYAVRGASVFLSEDSARRLERWRRGREEFRKLGLADYVVASYGKSGRTWLRVLISRYYQLAYDVPDNLLLGFDNFHNKDSRVPRIFFTHDNYLRSYTGNLDTKRDFYDKRTLLLVRRPEDVAVSQYFQWKFRMRPGKKSFLEYPPHGSDISLYDFVMSPGFGLPKIIAYMNLWASELPKIRSAHMVRYEDLRARPEEVFAGVVGFLGEPAKPEFVSEAIHFGSVENLRKLERQDFFWRSGSRVTPRDKQNPDSYKVRRAKVGGYRDYFEDEQLERIEAMVRDDLDPSLGYTPLDASASE